MKKMLIGTFALALALVPTVLLAQTLVSQGSGSPTVQDWSMSTAARFAGKTTEVLVTNAAGGSTVPATALTRRKAIELQNLGPNVIYCTVDGQSPLATGALGRRVDANGGTWSLDAGPGITVKCIAATAAQLTTAATQVTELR